jgi:hypothetical protein
MVLALKPTQFAQTLPEGLDESPGSRVSEGTRRKEAYAGDSPFLLGQGSERRGGQGNDKA